MVYNWGTSQSKCCLGLEKCEGSFNVNVLKSEVVSLGSIPKGINSFAVRLSSPVDVDLQLFDSTNSIPIVAFSASLDSSYSKSPILGNDRMVKTGVYDGMSVTYSGFVGGSEYISISGKTTTELLLKAYGYEAGKAQVDYDYYHSTTG